jgi:hypothetical protein
VAEGQVMQPRLMVEAELLIAELSSADLAQA